MTFTRDPLRALKTKWSGRREERSGTRADTALRRAAAKKHSDANRTVSGGSTS